MATYLASNASELSAALLKAAGGDRIELLSGSYGDLNIKNIAFSSEVTIAAHGDGPPPIINSISMTSAKNITFDGIDLSFTPISDTLEWSCAFRASESSNISIINSRVTGGDAISGIDPSSDPGTQGDSGINGYPIGVGINFLNCNQITIENNTISEFSAGVRFSNVDGITLNKNEIFGLRCVPVGGGNVNNVTMEDNYFHDMNPWKFGGDGDHGDFVHFWTTTSQKAPSENFIFSGNEFSQGDGAAILGIYLDDNTNSIGFSNVVISDNVIYNGNAQGLRLENVSGLEITNNSLIQSSGSPKDAPGIILSGATSDATISSNILGNISGLPLLDTTGNHISIFNNFYVQKFESIADGYYGNVFIASSLQEVDGRYGFLLLPGSTADQIGAGAQITSAPDPADILAARFHITTLAGD